MVKELELKKFIKKKCEEERGLEKELARIAGYSNSSGFHHFIYNEKKEMDNIQGIIDVIQKVSPEYEFDLMSEYILTLDINKSAARQGLEYLSVNQLYDTLDKHIKKMVSAKNSVSKEWGKVYATQRELDKGNIGIEECIRLLAEIHPKSSEMKVFSRIIPMYAILSLKQFGRLKDMSETVLIDTISNHNYVYHSFKSRYMLLLANCFFGNNEIEKAQKYARHGIENSNVKRIIFFSFLTYGSSLMLDDYEKSKSSFLKGLEVGKGNKIYKQHAIRNLCFLENLWGKENQYLNIESNEIVDKQEVVHYLIRKGSKQQAKKMLDQLDLVEHDDNDLGLHYYLKGLLENSREYFLESVKYFKLSGDKFSCTLPIIELEKLGVDKQILEIISI